jgi:hypothetical protein
LNVGLVAIAADMIRRVRPTAQWRSGAVATSAAIVALAAVSYLVAALAGSHWNFTDWAVVYYASLHFALLWCPYKSWHELKQVAPGLDAILADPQERKRCAKWLERPLSIGRQVLAVVLGVGAGAVFTLCVCRALQLPVADCVPFLISMSVTLGLGANTVQWLCSGAVYIERYSRLRSFWLNEYVPEETPGLREIYDLLRRASYRVSVGLFLATVPLITFDALAPQSRFLLVFTLTAFIFSTLVVLAVTVGSRRALSRIRETHKASLLRSMSESLPSLVSREQRDITELAAAAQLIETVKGRRTKEFSLGGAVQVAATMIGVIPSFVSLFLAL